MATDDGSGDGDGDVDGSGDGDGGVDGDLFLHCCFSVPLRLLSSRRPGRKPSPSCRFCNTTLMVWQTSSDAPSPV